MKSEKVVLTCKKDWTINGEKIEFKEGVEYEGYLLRGLVRSGINTFEVQGEYGFKTGFHTSSDYFDIPE